MMQVIKNIYPTFDQLVSRDSKEWLLQQHAKVIWLTGLSGSGKTTIAKEAEKVLYDMGHLTMLIDGDNVRTGLNNNLGFSEEDRTENIRRVAETARLFKECGVITLCTFVSPGADMRRMAAEIIGEEDFIEIYINTPMETCEQRDVKGLYARARRGEIKDFTGISAPFEAPSAPALEISTEGRVIGDSVDDLLNFIVPLVQLSKG
jgi:adenylylsulfate kinase